MSSAPAPTGMASRSGVATPTLPAPSPAGPPHTTGSAPGVHPTAPSSGGPNAAAARAGASPAPAGGSPAPADANPAASAPSTEWHSPTRTELSPEHVALLAWWADMIAKGQLPAPNDAATPAAGSADVPQPAKRGFRRRRAAHSTPPEPAAVTAGAATLASAVAATSPQAGTAPAGTAPVGAMPAGTAPAGTIPAGSITAGSAPTSHPPMAAAPFPAPDSRPAPFAAPPPQRPDQTKSSRRGPLLIGLGLGALALTGLAIAFGPTLYDAVTADEAPTAVMPATLTMPTAVGDLVALTGPAVDEQLVQLIGLGSRPSGITATSGYGADAGSPLVLAAMATSLPAPGSDAEQIVAWATRTGATTGDPVPGSGATAGITCADATEVPSAQSGAVCVWTGSGERGLTFAVATSAASALDTTATFRTALQESGTVTP